MTSDVRSHQPQHAFFHLRVCTALCLLGAAATGDGKTETQAQDSSVFEPIVKVHETQKNVGLALALSQHGTVVAEQYLGEAVVGHAVPVGPETRFQVMSITKAFVGAALLKAVSAGVVDLDLPIQRYLPAYPAPAAGTITLRRLAAHTAGLPHLGHPQRKALYLEHFTSARQALSSFRDLPLRHEPGTAYAYSSAGYTLIAAILEQVYGKPFPALLEDLVLEPLGLAATRSGNVFAPTPHLARNYSFIDVWTYEPLETLQVVPTWDFSFNYGGGNLVSTARELARFADAFTLAGFFTTEELAMLSTPIDAERSQWTFGWFVNEDDDGRRYLAISGATPGVQAGLVVYPQARVVLAALANAWGKDSAGGDLVVSAPRRVARDFMREREREQERTQADRP